MSKGRIKKFEWNKTCPFCVSDLPLYHVTNSASQLLYYIYKYYSIEYVVEVNLSYVPIAQRKCLPS